MTHQVRLIKCSESACTATFKDHYWGHVRAHSDGWFIPRDESAAWCPKHLPEWVPAWRASKS